MSCVAASEAKDAGMDVAQWGHKARRDQVRVSTTKVSTTKVSTTADGWERHRALKTQRTCLGVRTQADIQGKDECTLWPLRLHF